MAFQIIDDVLDYVGNDESIKKSAANDLNDSDIKEIVRLVKENKGVENAIELAQKYTNKAFAGIDKLPDNGYKNILKK